MRYSIVTISGKNYKQVNKVMARKLFAQEVEIFLHPCNMSLYSHWSNLCPIKLDRNEINNNIGWAEKCKIENWELKYTPCLTPELQFNSIVKEYESYNCIQELGKYANFFIIQN